MSTALLRRGNRLLDNRNNAILLNRSTIAIRYASLNSAIGRGLRKSQGVGFRGKERSREREPSSSNGSSVIRRTSEVGAFARPQGGGLTRDGWKNASGSSERPRERNVFGTSKNATTRLRKGKVDVKDVEAPVRRSRAARFHDPNSSFGKKSAAQSDKFKKTEISTQWREGGLSMRKGESNLGKKSPFITAASRRAAESDLAERQRNPDGTKLSASRVAYLGRTAGKSGQPSRESFDDKSSNRPRDSDRESQNSSQDFTRKPRSIRDEPWNGRDSKNIRDEPWNDRNSRHTRDESWNNRDSKYNQDESRKDNRDRSARRESEEEVKPRSTFDKRLPLSIPYTTPASEFLYGASVVKAALKSTRSPRRKLYKLYIYTGENRDNAETDYAMERLARRNKVDVVHADTDSIRLLDKMSGGRPHNGYILEASPLPKLPVTSLGRLKTKDGVPGFSVALDHQSREEAAVNGTDNFVPVSTDKTGRKPFVLLLDSILDPGNLGGIIRTASFLGVTAIAISTRNSATFTPVVLKASAGASENITLFSINKPAGFVTDSQFAGWKIYAAVAPPGPGNQVKSLTPLVTTEELGAPLEEAPVLLMLGNEGEGLRWNLRSKADVEVAIQGSANSGGVDSLNVSVAMGILCNAFLRGTGAANVEVRKEKSEENLF